MLGTRLSLTIGARTVLASALLLFLTVPCDATLFEDSIGWKDDVDLVVSPDGEFLVVPEQAVNGAAKVRMIDLDPATGEPLGMNWHEDVPGFEIGVDPIVVPELGANLGHTVLLPLESPDGLVAELWVLLIDDSGLPSFTRIIELGDLGFRPDVDGIFTFYAGPAIAFFPLETPDGAVRGVLAIDVDPRPGFGDVGVGACTLLSTDGRPGADINIAVSWLQGLADGVDPVAYEIIACCARLALPVQNAGGGDLLLIDFDPNVPSPPHFLSHKSVRQVNELGTRPTDFPGWEYDVDIMLSNLSCAPGENSMLIPVEGPGDVADVYLIDKDGNSIWVLSLDGAAGGVTLPGFEKGVDLLPLCGLPGPNPNQLLVSIENAGGTDADIWFVDIATGQLLAKAESVNGGLTVEGFEIGIDAIRWVQDRILVPVESAAGIARLLLFDENAVLVEATDFPLLQGDWGYTRSVDPVIVELIGQDPKLYVPLARSDNAEKTDVLAYLAPPTLVGAQSLEAINIIDDLELGEFVNDLDLGVVYPLQPGEAWIYLAEEDSTGANARLRFELVPVTAGEPTLILATRETESVAASLRFFWATFGGHIGGFEDVLGLESGLDLANGRGSATPGNPPYTFTEGGYDADTDPTLSSMTISTGLPFGTEENFGTRSSLEYLRNANPQMAPVGILLSLSRAASVDIAIFDPSGRRVRRLLSGRRESGQMDLIWDGKDEGGRRVSAGVYFITARSGSELRSSKIVLIR